MKKIDALRNTLHRWHSINGLIAILVLLSLFSNALATQSETKTSKQAADLTSVDVKFLLKDIHFEAQQSQRDIQRIDDEFRKTLASVKSTHFTCSALSTVLSERNIFESLVQTSANLTANSARADILSAYQYYAKIRGNGEIVGIRAQLYGGDTDPETKKTIAGTISELQACRTIASVVTRTCDVYASAIEASKSAPKSTADLYTNAAQEIEDRCTQPNVVFLNSKMPLANFSQSKQAEKIFGANDTSKKINRIKRKSAIDAFTQNNRKLFTMLESL